jgi:hypothetical protein
VFCTTAAAVDVVFQALDTVKTYSNTSVLDMAFDDPRRSADFFDSGVSGSEFRACQLTAINGLYCLDAKSVRQWPNSADPLIFSTLIDCEDPVLNLDTRKADTCTGMTVDLMGTVWLAGKNKGKSHSLIKALPVAATDSCPAGFERLAAGAYCAREVATGRPLLVDITPIDGDFAALFPLGPGILGLEQRKTAVFFDVDGAATELASGKRDWNQPGNEQLTGIAALQISTGADTANNYVVVATTAGRILAKLVGSSQSAISVFDIAANREAGSTQCDFNDATYGIRASSKSGFIYVTDRQFCQVIALNADADGSGNLTQLINATEPVFDIGGTQIDTTNLTLETADGPAATFPPEGPTIAPGINVDLNDCQGVCPLIIDINGNVAASLADVQLASQESGLTLFQVKNIPDCRYDPLTCQTLLGITDLLAAGVILDPDGTGLPQAQLLNLTAMLPQEITDLFLADGGLPDMYLARQYRGQQHTGFTFEAFFGVVEEGVIFRETFESEFNVQALAGTELGCKLGLPNSSPLYTVNEGQPDEMFGTLNWDIVNSVSETYVSLVDASDPTAPDHVTTLTNSDCASSKSRDGRWSIKPYNLEVTPCSYNNDAGDVWVSDGSCPVGGPELADDAVLAKLLIALFDELGAALNNLACADADGAGSPPLSAGACASLDADWFNAKDKLDKCWGATQQPKQSSGDQNCQAFVSQLNGFESTLDGTVLFGTDPANRRGELKARVLTIRHLYDERVVPSIPAAGFVEP